MTMQNAPSDNPKKEWKKTKIFLAIFIAIFNPITILAVILIFFLCLYLIITPICKNNSRLMKAQLLPLCNGDHYVYDDCDHYMIRFNYNDSLECYSRYGKLESCNFDYYEIGLLMFTNDYYYFLIKESNNNKKYVCRTTHDLDNFETLCYLGDSKIENMVHGYNSKLYYESENQYYVLDLFTLELQLVDSNSEEAMVVETSRVIDCKYHGYYESISRTYFGDCVRENNNCCFSLSETNYSFNEDKIDPKVFKLMESFSFKPMYHLSSLDTGATAIMYYANKGFGGESECLIIDFIRSEENPNISYQLFTNVNQHLFRLLPTISFAL